jgi:hypothetical protein
MKHLIDVRSAGLVIALTASVGLAVAACGGPASPSSSATPSSGATPSPSATLAAAFDPCLVGTWTVVAQNQNSPANDESIVYSGGAGEIFTIDAEGGVTIDTHAAQKVVFVSVGQTFTATVAGTGRGTLSTVASAPITTWNLGRAPMTRGRHTASVRMAWNWDRPGRTRNSRPSTRAPQDDSRSTSRRSIT